jgi:predicted ArsR family transcriptional regulator
MQLVWEKSIFKYCGRCLKFRQIYCICEEESNNFCSACGNFLIISRGIDKTKLVQEQREKPEVIKRRKVKQKREAVRPFVNEKHRAIILGLLAKEPLSVYDIAPAIERSPQTALFHCDALIAAGKIESYRRDRGSKLYYCLAGEKEKLIDKFGLETEKIILNLLSEYKRPLTTEELANEAKLNKTTIRKICSKMHQQGLINAWIEQKRYHTKYYSLPTRTE